MMHLAIIFKAYITLLEINFLSRPEARQKYEVLDWGISQILYGQEFSGMGEGGEEFVSNPRTRSIQHTSD